MHVSDFTYMFRVSLRQKLGRKHFGNLGLLLLEQTPGTVSKPQSPSGRQTCQTRKHQIRGVEERLCIRFYCSFGPHFRHPVTLLLVTEISILIHGFCFWWLGMVTVASLYALICLITRLCEVSDHLLLLLILMFVPVLGLLCTSNITSKGSRC